MSEKTPLQAAVIEALGLGAQVADTRPYTLADGPWQRAVSEAALVELLTADPGKLGQILGTWQDLEDRMIQYRRAKQAGDARNMAWWKQRLAEDCGYHGPFPGAEGGA